MMRRGLISIEDLSNEEIEDVLDLAQEMASDIRGYSSLAQGEIMASLFFEPSTRTRGSFESAMNRLGGRVISTVGTGSSSMEKGETLSDTIRVWSRYSDLITLRHPWEGSARLASEHASVPVINAGDGGHEHPTQTLCDLFTLRSEKGTLEGLRVALCGDLKHGRTIHSLIFGLLRFGADLVFVPGEGLGLPEHIRSRIVAKHGVPIEKIQVGDLGALYGEADQGPSLDALYMTRRESHQRRLFEDSPKVEFQISRDEEIVIYVTRKQVERGAKSGGSSGGYPRVSRAVMKDRLSKAIVLHPLPRVDELSYDMDEDDRSKYFDQAGNGVPVRMALLSLALGLKPWRRAGQEGRESDVVTVKGIGCVNEGCVVNREPQSCQTRFAVMNKPELTFICRYCEWHNSPPFYGFQQSGQRRYRSIDRFPKYISQYQLYQFRFFGSEEEALSQGYILSVQGPEQTGTIYEVDNDES